MHTQSAGNNLMSKGVNGGVMDILYIIAMKIGLGGGGGGGGGGIEPCLHCIPKLSASVKYSFASPDHCLVILPTS